MAPCYASLPCRAGAPYMPPGWLRTSQTTLQRILLWAPWIAWIILGLAAGLLANVLISIKRSHGLIVTFVIGIIGAVGGGWAAATLFHVRSLRASQHPCGTPDDGVACGSPTRGQQGDRVREHRASSDLGPSGSP